MSSVLRNQKIKIDEAAAPTYLPEVITEILIRLPFKSLTRLQLVCKAWRALISHDRYFTKEYLDHGSVLTHWYNCHNVSPRSELQRDVFSYIHGCDGLVLIKNKTVKQHCLWNPATRLVLELPDPHKGRHGMAVSFVRATKSYRIVSFFKDKESGEESCEVFTPGESREWRRLTNFPIIKDGKRQRDSVVAAGGAIHCVFVTEVGSIKDIEIVSLDMETETFTASHLRPLDGWKNFREVEWDGKLAVVDIVGQNIEVMELEDHKKQRWCGERKVIHLPFLKNCGYGGVGNVIPLFAMKGEIWFWLKEKKVFTYTIETGKLTHVVNSRTFAVSSNIYAYKPSLITFEGMVPDTKFELLRSEFGVS